MRKIICFVFHFYCTLVQGISGLRSYLPQLKLCRKICSVPFLISIFLSSHLAIYLFAVPHINGKNPGPKEYVRPLPQKRIERTITTTGTRKIAVILVNFASAGSNTSGSETMTSSDITGFNTTFGYLKNFYKEASYEKLNLDITFFYNGGSTSTLTGTETPFTLSTPMSTYGADTESSLGQLVIDALNICGQVSIYNFDGVMVAHAGYGNESTSDGANDGNIWSCYIGPFTNTFGFEEGTIVPAREKSDNLGSPVSPIGVTCHEFGHQLGLWDLYSTGVSGGATQVGVWSIMDYGPWLYNGFYPPHPSCWEKEKLGWLTPVEISSGTKEFTTYPFETNPDTVYKLNSADSEEGTEYFLVCHTSKTAYSPKTPGDGLLIWHIDEGTIDGVSFEQRKLNNALNNYSHRTVDVEEADYSDPSLNLGDATDLWPGERQSFTPPYSDKYNNQPSMVNVLNISNYVQFSSFTVSYKPFISGYVRNSAGNAMSDVVVYLSSVTPPNSYTETRTDTSGYYVFTDLSDATYTITPAKADYNFLPASLTVTISGYYSNNNNFTGIAAVSYADLTNKPNNIKPVNNLFVPGAEKTTIYYKTAQDGHTIINIYTLDGRLVKKLVDEYIPAGINSVDWEGRNDENSAVASGIYLVHISAPGYKATKKICVIR
ncbi:MAG: M6 family metalloprotease domain-containing protein [Elusimicrobiota bacterium]